MIVNSTGFQTNRITDIYKNSSTAKTGSSFSDTLSSTINESGRTDTIEISSDAKAAENNHSALSGIKNKIESDMFCGTDETKLDNIKVQIGNGSYKIDPSELADCLLNDI